MEKIKKILIFIILFLGMLIFPYVVLLLTPINYNGLSDSNKMLYNFICDFIYIIIIFWVYRKRMIKEFKDYRDNFKNYFKLSIKYYGIGLFIMYLTNFLISIIFPLANANNDDAVKSVIDNYPLYMLFSTLIYAPIVEETIFRRSIKDIFLTFGNNRFIKYVYIIISGLLFATAHIIGHAETGYDYLYIIPYLSVGIVLGIIYYKTDNLFVSMMVHAFHNALAFLIYFLIGV